MNFPTFYGTHYFLTLVPILSYMNPIFVLQVNINIIFPTVSMPLKLSIFFVRPRENVRTFYFRHV